MLFCHFSIITGLKFSEGEAPPPNDHKHSVKPKHEAQIPTRVDGLHKAFIRGLDQFLRFFVHVADEEGFIEVAVETVVVDCDVHCRKQ